MREASLRQQTAVFPAPPPGAARLELCADAACTPPLQVWEEVEIEAERQGVRQHGTRGSQPKVGGTDA